MSHAREILESIERICDWPDGMLERLATTLRSSNDHNTRALRDGPPARCALNFPPVARSPRQLPNTEPNIDIPVSKDSQYHGDARQINGDVVGGWWNK